MRPAHLPHSVQEDAEIVRHALDRLLLGGFTGADTHKYAAGMDALARLEEQNERLTQNIIDCNARSRTLAEKVIGLEEQLETTRGTILGYRNTIGGLKDEAADPNVSDAEFRELFLESYPPASSEPGLVQGANPRDGVDRPSGHSGSEALEPRP